ncbi:PhnA domain-containing protein [Thiomicrorhabdus sp. ZW0627]|uniref:PhnA domain-containing protein n=1 Tax=Thiomicrorhabdus sp. ZW0627 TaxID=3039774 RepID=UPI002436AE35|nr:alkylphosphonate utilization protein [Thiomicrorhabdus sp. ZW0627]MDG6773110.1 PhnA domain-containing protein [Thiomicrorhabdus sp. ZW0627]
MSIEQALLDRSGSKCELCGSEENLSTYEVAPSDGSVDQSIVVCQTCKEQIESPEKMDANHWRCLNDSMWSPVPAVQVMAYRLLNQLRSEGWPQDLLDMMYMEDDVKAWANAGLPTDDEDAVVHKDSNGAILQEGDSVTLIKDLEVKGGGFTAKRGTLVKNIHLTDNPIHIEGKVNGTQIVLVTEYLKKAN